ncbi:MAG: proteasome accessory factor PafA2 family protein [Thermoguttaceae bacterium]|jgi:proteasome accessory factor A
MAIAKYIARDAELMTAGVDADGRPIQQWNAVQKLLLQVGAAFEPYGHEPWTHHEWSNNLNYYSTGYYGGYNSGYQGGYNSCRSTDCLRHWTGNGQCYYSDMSHWEGCTAEVLSPFDYALQCLSSLQVAEEARRRAEELGEGARFTLSAQNVDAQDPSISWGTHLNISVSRGLFQDLFLDHRHPARLGFVASAIAAAVPWFGTGYILPLKDGSRIFSLSGRAHHLDRVISHSTTVAFQRGLLNSRREPHGNDADRLHLIGFDFNLASAVLSAGFLQCVMAAAEEGFCGLQLYDPVHAARVWSWGMDLSTRTLCAEALLIDGRKITLPVYIRELVAVLLQMVEGGLIGEDVAPHARQILPIVIETTYYAEEGSLESLAKHSDWAALLTVLLGMCEQPGTRLGDPDTVLTVQDYSNTDPSRGLFWQLWDQSLVDPLVNKADVERCLRDGPKDTRAWARGRLVQKFHRCITAIDWSYVELLLATSRWNSRLRIEMPRLGSLSRNEFKSVLETAQSVEELELLMQQTAAPISASDPVLDINSQLETDPITYVGTAESESIKSQDRDINKE